MHGIDKTLSEADAITAIETIMNALTPEPAPDTNERIAAAMEFQNLMMMEDATV
jgi:hypothetical protein